MTIKGRCGPGPALGGAFLADPPGDIPADGGTMPSDEEGEPFRI